MEQSQLIVRTEQPNIWVRHASVMTTGLFAFTAGLAAYPCEKLFCPSWPIPASMIAITATALVSAFTAGLFGFAKDRSKKSATIAYAVGMLITSLSYALFAAAGILINHTGAGDFPNVAFFFFGGFVITAPGLLTAGGLAGYVNYRLRVGKSPSHPPKVLGCGKHLRISGEERGC